MLADKKLKAFVATAKPDEAKAFYKNACFKDPDGQCAFINRKINARLFVKTKSRF